MRTNAFVFIAILSVGLGSASALGQEPKPGDTEARDQATPAAPKLHVVEAGELTLEVRSDGRLEPIERAAVRFAPEVYDGPLEVSGILRRSGRVELGEPLLEIRTAHLDRQLRAADERHQLAERRLELLGEETNLDQEAQERKLAQAERRLVKARRAAERFEAFDKEQLVRRAELSVKAREHGLSDQLEELAQLESMYEGTKLESGTKEIVLNRARRLVRQLEAYLDLERKNREAVHKFEHPDRLAAVAWEHQRAEEDLEHLRKRTRLARINQALDLEAAKRSLRDATEHLEKLKRDGKRFVLRAPTDGIVTRINLRVGDVIKARNPIGWVLDVDRYEVRCTVKASDLRILHKDAVVELRLPAFREARLKARVRELSTIGAPGEDGATFALRALVNGDSPLLRPGLRCVIYARGETRRSVLTIPTASVHAYGAGHACYVWKDGVAVEHAITLGAEANGRIEVTSGLSAGVSVLVEDPKEAGLPIRAAREESEEDSRQGRRGENEDTEQRTSRSPAEAHAAGLAFLLRSQQADGSWGQFASARTREIYLGTVASHRAFRLATTALCISALSRPAKTDTTAKRALDRAIAFVLTSGPVARATGDTFYDTWAHAYLLDALAQQIQSEPTGTRKEQMATVVRREIRQLSEQQAAEGGWGYYDFGYSRPTPAGHYSTSFLTALSLLALQAAQEAGFTVDPTVLEDGLQCLERYRLPSGAFVYGTRYEALAGRMYNRVKGSIGRSLPCLLALWSFTRGVDAAELKAGLARFREHHHFLRIGRGRPMPHEAWYATAGYYYLFGHYYAGELIQALNENKGADSADSEVENAAKADLDDWLAQALVADQGPDGAWIDFPLYGYHRQYGTAFALLALQAAAPEILPR